MGYENRYAGLSSKQCDREALLLMEECIGGQRKWEDVSERLVCLRRVKGYAPEPGDESVKLSSRN